MVQTYEGCNAGSGDEVMATAMANGEGVIFSVDAEQATTLADDYLKRCLYAICASRYLVALLLQKVA